MNLLDEAWELKTYEKLLASELVIVRCMAKEMVENLERKGEPFGCGGAANDFINRKNYPIVPFCRWNHI